MRSRSCSPSFHFHDQGLSLKLKDPPGRPAGESMTTPMPVRPRGVEGMSPLFFLDVVIIRP